MEKLTYRGSWPETMRAWSGGLAVVVDESGVYSRHSHFVQAVRRLGVGDVFSRKGVCYIMPEVENNG